jgi:NADPH:quinone reductase-like Zn-dependent oxidoreductase
VKALLLASAEGPQSAHLAEVAEPEPTAGEIKVELHAASLNHRELWISRGLYPGMALPTVMGADGAGIVSAIGEAVDPVLLGKRVVLYPALNWGEDEDRPSDGFGLLGMPGPGTIAESIVIPAGNAVEIPAHLDFIHAASLPVAALTAFRALTRRAALKAGERLLITGVGGGVASLALLFAKAMGAHVIVTRGSHQNLAAARQCGADEIFNYRKEGWGKALRKSGLVDVVFDGAPAASFSSYARSLAPGSRVVVYGSTGGVDFNVFAPDLFLHHASIIGTAMGSPSDFRSMIDFVERYRLEPIIERVFRLEEAQDALLHLEQGHQLGKVAIKIR